MTGWRRWWVGVAAVTVVALVLVLVSFAGDDDEGTEHPASSSSVTASASSTTTTSTSTTTTTQASTTTTAVALGAVTVLEARPGGGSGEIVLTWEGVAGATGYQVVRASSSTGPFTEAAAFDTTTGTATAATDVVNLLSDEHSYVPSAGALTSPDPSTHFEYVEASGAPTRCFRVVAVGPDGTGPESAVVCGSPP